MADSFDRVYDNDDLYYPHPSAFLVDFLGRRTLVGSVGTDLGCGDGRNSILLAQLGAAVTAIDSSAVGVSKLNHRAEQLGLEVDARVGDIAQWNADQGSLNFVICSTVLEHLPHADSRQLLRRLPATVCSGGWIYVSVFTTEDPSYRRPLPATSGLSRTADFVISNFEPQELLDEVRQSGLRIVSYREGQELDASHGPEHMHGIARVVALKGGE